MSEAAAKVIEATNQKYIPKDIIPGMVVGKVGKKE